MGRTSNVLREAAEAFRQLDLKILLAVLTLVLGAWIFLEIAQEVTEGETHALDEAIILALRNPEDRADPIGPLWFQEAMRDWTALGSVAVLGLVIGAVVGYLVLARKFHASGLILVATVGGQLLSTLLKGYFDRPRPDVVPHLMHASQASFPSGHSLMSAVVYLTLGALLARLIERRWLKVYCIVVAVLLTILVGVTRVYLGVHYPTDVLAGWTAGLVWAVLCWMIARYLQRRGVVEPKMD